MAVQVVAPERLAGGIGHGLLFACDHGLEAGGGRTDVEPGPDPSILRYAVADHVVALPGSHPARE